MNGKLISYGVAALIGLLAAVAYYELTPAADSAGNTPIGTLEVKTTEILGSVSAFEEGDLLVLQIDIDTNEPTKFHAELSNQDLVFKSISIEHDSTAQGFLFAKGNFAISTSARMSFRVVLSVPEVTDGVPDNDVNIILYQNREVVFQETLDL